MTNMRTNSSAELAEPFGSYFNRKIPRAIHDEMLALDYLPIDRYNLFMAQTKERLKSIATRTIQEKGVNGLSFRDLAAEANIKSSSVHYYFPQKSDLIYEVAKEYTEAFSQALDRIDQSSNRSVDRLDALLNLYKTNLPSRFCLCGMLAADSNQLDDKTKDLLSKFFVQTQKWLQEVIEDLPRTGATPAGLSGVLLSSLEGALLMDGVKGKEKYLSDVQKFIRGLK